MMIGPPVVAGSYAVSLLYLPAFQRDLEASKTVFLRRLLVVSALNIVSSLVLWSQLGDIMLPIVAQLLEHFRELVLPAPPEAKVHRV